MLRYQGYFSYWYTIYLHNGEINVLYLDGHVAGRRSSAVILGYANRFDSFWGVK